MMIKTLGDGAAVTSTNDKHISVIASDTGNKKRDDINLYFGVIRTFVPLKVEIA
jgi:hypothetical protein